MNWFSTFSELCSPRCCVCKWNLCHEIAFSVCGCVPTWIKFTLTLFSPPSLFLTLFLFYLRFLFLLACSTCLLCTTFCYYFLLLPQFLALVYDLLFVLTKPNWTFSSLFFFSSGLEDCCCLVLLFSFFAPCCAMCTCDVMRLRKCVWVRAWAIASLSRACFDGNGLFLSASAPAWLCVSESLMGDF